MKFTKLISDPHSSARTGLIETDHGTVHTPIFMPVGTVGSVKGVYHRDLKEDIGAEIILGNTYHLYLRPGLDTLRAAGGLHKFENWDRPILTDSGGFQIFSLTGIRKLTPEGCTFQSHIDGSRHTFTPENNVDTQRIIGADIMMALDECCPGDADHAYAARSLQLTKNWLERYARRFHETEPLYGYDQTFSKLAFYGEHSVDKSWTGLKLYVTSSKPATLTVTDGAITVVYTFQGYAVTIIGADGAVVYNGQRCADGETILPGATFDESLLTVYLRSLGGCSGDHQELGILAAGKIKITVHYLWSACAAADNHKMPFWSLGKGLEGSH